MKRKLLNWARNCHFDGCIAIKEEKGKRWMYFLNMLESKFEFSTWDMESEEAWSNIKKYIGKLTEDEAEMFLQNRKNT